MMRAGEHQRPWWQRVAWLQPPRHGAKQSMGLRSLMVVYDMEQALSVLLGVSCSRRYKPPESGLGRDFLPRQGWRAGAVPRQGRRAGAVPREGWRAGAVP